MAARNHNRLIIAFVVGALLLLCSPARGLARSVAYQIRTVRGAPVHIVTADLNDPQVRVTVVTARNFPSGNESFASMVYGAQPSAAVTGTYFSNASLLPVGDIVIDGHYRHFGGLGTAIAFTPYNDVTFRTVPWGEHQDWSAFETVLGAGPRLVHQGQVSLEPRREGFRDPHVFGWAQRTAVGVTRAHKLLLMATQKPVSLGEWANIARSLGCVEAINLDGGSSTAMYYQGRFVVHPGRKLVNILAVYEDVSLLTRAVTRMPADTARIRAWREAKAQEHFEAGERLADRGEASAATRNRAIAAKLAPDNASYALALAESLDAEGRTAESAPVFARAGELLLDKRLYAEAIGPLGEAVRRQPREIATRVALAAAYQGVGGHEAAARQVLAARVIYEQLTRPPNGPRPAAGVAWASTRTGAIPGDPEQQAWLARALALARARDPREAVRIAWLVPLGPLQSQAANAQPHLDRKQPGREPAEAATTWLAANEPGPDGTKWRRPRLIAETPSLHTDTDLTALIGKLRQRALRGGGEAC
jgi:tetratricopeptide (TPR) repeat protein